LVGSGRKKRVLRRTPRGGAARGSVRIADLLGALNVQAEVWTPEARATARTGNGDGQNRQPIRRERAAAAAKQTRVTDGAKTGGRMRAGEMGGTRAVGEMEARGLQGDGSGEG
jgi:hypothetical protein